MNETLNISNTPEPTLIPPRMEAWNTTFTVLSVFIWIIGTCGMVGNGVVLSLLGFRVKRNPFSVYVLNLAVADFLFLLSLFTMFNLLKFVTLYSIVTYLIQFSIALMFFSYFLGLSLLTIISIQRCLSVLFPIWYKVHRPQHLSTVVCSILWVLALLVTTLTIYLCITDSQECDHILNFLIIVLLGIFTPVMILSSTVIFVQHQRRPREWRKRSFRLFVIILTSVLMFVICSLPFSILLTFINKLQIHSEDTYQHLFLTLLTSSLSSSANPFIYFLAGKWKHRHLREPLKTVLTRALQDTELVDNRMPSTDTSEMGSLSHSTMASTN